MFHIYSEWGKMTGDVRDTYTGTQPPQTHGLVESLSVEHRDIEP